MAFEQHALNVGNIPVTDVAAEDRLKAQLEGIGARIECPMDAGIVGLASEKEILEDTREVVFLAHTTSRPFVAVRTAIVPRNALIVGAIELFARRGDVFATAILPEQGEQLRTIQERRVVVLQAFKVALLPMLLE